MIERHKTKLFFVFLHNTVIRPLTCRVLLILRKITLIHYTRLVIMNEMIASQTNIKKLFQQRAVLIQFGSMIEHGYEDRY